MVLSILTDVKGKDREETEEKAAKFYLGGTEADGNWHADRSRNRLVLGCDSKVLLSCCFSGIGCVQGAGR